MRLNLGTGCRRDVLLSNLREEILSDSALAQEAWLLWTRLQSQWRVGMSGATGLDYAAIRPAAEFLLLPLEDMPALFDVLQELEGHQIKTWGEERAAKEADDKREADRKKHRGRRAGPAEEEEFVAYGDQFYGVR